MTHSVIQDLNWRYTAKKYDPARKVAREDLDVLYEALRLTPSSINSQPWRFVVLESDEAKQRMSRTFGENFSFNRDHVEACTVVILFAHNPGYSREDYARVVDKGIEDGRTRPEEREQAFAPFVFAELNTDGSGNNGCWTKAQTYIALGNALHTLARMRIDSTPMEGIDVERVNEEFREELDGYRCEVALAVGYRDPRADYNARLPKSRLDPEEIFVSL